MEKSNKIKHSDKEARAKRIYERIMSVLLIAAAVSLFVHWKYSLCVIGIMLWSVRFYEYGCMEWVCDEHEQDGYPTQGLRRMFQSWKILAVILAVIVILLHC